jgi:transcription initiation factor TFIIF subunit beta
MNGIKADPDVKMDHDAITPSGSGYMDDDFYEDTGELALPPKNQEKDVWITRIPKYLYDAISNYDELTEGRDDELVVLGEVLALRDPQRPTSVSKTEPIRVILNHPTIAQKQLPQAFDLKMAPAPKEVLGNTYVFTEKDLPGYKPGGYGQGRQGSFGGVQDPKARVGKRSKYKKAIPSTLHRTATVPTSQS